MLTRPKASEGAPEKEVDVEGILREDAAPRRFLRNFAKN